MPDATASEPDDAAICPRRSWWRFRLSLRALMVLVVLIGAPLGWVARRAAIQRRAVARVQALGGRVLYEDQLDPAGTYGLAHQPGGPAWLRRVVGDEPFQEVAGVVFVATDPQLLFDPSGSPMQVDDASLAVVNDFPHLRLLSMVGVAVSGDKPPVRSITAAGLARLTGVPRLRVLSLDRLGVDAALVRLLPRWAELEEVRIVEGGPQTLDGSCLPALGALPKLRSVYIDSLAVPKAEDVAPLLRLDHLTHLGLNHSPRDDAGMAQLGSIPSLIDINLPQTAFTDATLAAVGRNSNLFFLDCDGSQLGPGAFRVLSGLQRLQVLTIRQGERGGDPGAWALTRRLPARFGDADLDALQVLPLTGLMIVGLDATDAGVGRLLSGRSFELLTLSGRGITDSSIPALAGQIKLDTLALADTGITDAGLAQLAALPALRNLSLVDNPAVTDAGMASLRSFPKLQELVHRQPGTQPTTIQAIHAGRRRFSSYEAAIYAP